MPATCSNQPNHLNYRWRKLDGANRTPKIIQGAAFKDGIKQLKNVG